MSKVVDGDTIRLATGDRVRLVQIDAPELSQHECYAKASKAELERLLPTRVRLEFDPALDQVDRFGRKLAYVFAGPVNVNLALVQRGAASVWFYRGRRGKYAARLLRAAHRAESSGIGLWLACVSTQLDPEHPIEAKAGPRRRPGPTAQPSG